MKILIGSAIRQDPDTLREFLSGLTRLEKPYDVGYCFVLHNLVASSRDILDNWITLQGDDVHLEIIHDETEYLKEDEVTHHWTHELVDKVTEMKNYIINHAKTEGYDYLFLTDSDQVYHPKTLTHLINRKLDLVGEISWAQWTPLEPEMPNAWMRHPYEFDDNSLLKLRTKNLVEVAGFGGCYLISREAINRGVSFTRTDNKTNWGEDRYFHIRSKQLGFTSYIDTVYPYFHIYRRKDIPRLHRWIENEYRNEELLQTQRGLVLISVCLGEKEIHPDTSAWITKTLLKNRGWGLDISRGHPIDSNRNSVVKKFLTLPEAQRYEWLLFCDSDVVPPDGGAERLLFHGKKIVGGVCWIMSEKGLPTLNISKDLDAGYVKAELTEVKGMGTGFILIHRDVLKTVGYSPFRFRYDKWGVANVCGEDYDFCEKAYKKGYKIYADLGIQCEHYKTVGLKSLNNKLTHIINEATPDECRPKKPSEDCDNSRIGD